MIADVLRQRAHQRHEYRHDYARQEQLPPVRDAAEKVVALVFQRKEVNYDGRNPEQPRENHLAADARIVETQRFLQNCPEQGRQSENDRPGKFDGKFLHVPEFAGKCKVYFVSIVSGRGVFFTFA